MLQENSEGNGIIFGDRFCRATCQPLRRLFNFLQKNLLSVYSF
jgi:hypothetical protein